MAKVTQLFFEPRKADSRPIALTPSQWPSNLNAQQNHQESLLQERRLGPIPRVVDSEGLGWSLRICIPNKFLVVLMVVLVWGPHFAHPLGTLSSHVLEEDMEPQRVDVICLGHPATKQQKSR